jgi:hypothetical protein
MHVAFLTKIDVYFRSWEMVIWLKNPVINLELLFQSGNDLVFDKMIWSSVHVFFTMVVS